ncbi:LuxR C-terminal-related transcriptional regulator [Streptacidiphilus melanogenes]|uniref:LuxR C-terminal-related transcriptional regulator n=1 Tax=Streptacidiphilus melanogenes TaxID=411235 RepID=UPI000A07B28B
MHQLITHACPECASSPTGSRQGCGGPTDLERELLALLAQGLTDATVAKRLNMSLRTERRMVAELMRRLGASGRFEAGVKAARRRWI